MKTQHFYPLILIAFVLIFNSYSQVPEDSMYFGIDPPGDSAIVFGPDSISLSNRKELKISFSPDRLECFFGTASGSEFNLYYSEFKEGHWTIPSIINFSNTYFEREPMISPDGKRMFFTAPQTPTSATWLTDIWVSEKSDTGWSEPTKLNGLVNSTSEEWHPSITNDSTLYFCSNRGSSDYYIYRAKQSSGQYNLIEKLSVAINYLGIGGSDPYIAPDESYLIFTSGPGTDQYISYKKTDGSWTNRKKLGSFINTEGIEYGSFVSYDSKYYFFSRVSGYGVSGTGDIHWVSSGFVDSLKMTNFSPYVKNQIPNQTDSVNNLFLYTIPDSIFYDDDGNETLTLSALQKNGNELPDWLSFDPNTKTFEGTPTEPTYYNIEVTATDTVGESVFSTFLLDIKGKLSNIENIESEQIIVYPNPAHDKIFIEYDANQIGCPYFLIDITGKILQHGIVKENSIDISSIDIGTYILKLYIKEEFISRKILID